jgi:hypothetical protein
MPNCKSFELQRVSWYEGCELLHPDFPHGWRKLDMNMICPKHKIKVTK